MAPQVSEVSAASARAAELLVRLVERGVRHVVLSPGSRSQALALVAAELEARGDIQLHVRIDERVAGFLALGIGVESHVPAVVITTSGSAVANLHPAILEAHYSGNPMIVLTADRPEELQGIGSNQTMKQPDIFGSAVRLSLNLPAPTEADETERAHTSSLADRVFDAATNPVNPGPVHLNLAFREPLSSNVPLRAVDSASTHAAAPSAADSTATRTLDTATRTLDTATRTLIIAGADSGERAEQVARDGNWPLIAEVTSGSRFGPQLVHSYREVLRDTELTSQIQRIVIFGHPTLSREVPQLIAQASSEVEVIVVRGQAVEGYNPAHRVNEFVNDVEIATSGGSAEDSAVATDEASMRWLVSWLSVGRVAQVALLDQAPDRPQAPDVSAAHSDSVADKKAFAEQELAASRQAVSRETLVEAVWRLTWPHDRLVFAASRLIRVADKSVGGKKISVHANRGLAGIDGNISTGIGIALAAQPALTRIVVGDLAAVHDAGALAIPEGERHLRVQVIVGNDGGGTIFDSLEVSKSAPHELADRVLLTPQDVDFSSLASAYGWSYQHVTTLGELERALTNPAGSGEGLHIIEVRLSR